MDPPRAELLNKVRTFLTTEQPIELNFNFQPASTPEEQSQRYEQYTALATSIGATFTGVFYRICDGCNTDLIHIIDVPKCAECGATYDLCWKCRDAGLSLSKCPEDYGCLRKNKLSPVDTLSQHICERFSITREELDELMEELR